MTVWTVAEEDGMWRVNGDRAPSHAQADSLGFCLEIVAEEAKRLKISDNATVRVEKGRKSWSAKMQHIVQDYQQ